MKELNSKVDGFRFAVGDSSDVGAGTWNPGTIGTWTTTEHTFTAGSSTIQIRFYMNDSRFNRLHKLHPASLTC